MEKISKEFENKMYSKLEEHIHKNYIDDSKNFFNSEWAKFSSNNEITYVTDDNTICFYINGKFELSIPCD